jgi:hypothetical protein
MLRIIFPCLFVFSFSSCTIVTKRGDENPAPVNSLDSDKTETSPVKIAVPSSGLTKTITDQDLKIKLEDQELKKRVVILPILDKENLRDSEVLKQAQLDFIDALNKTGELIALDSSVLKIDFKKFVKNGMYDLKAISQASNKAGVSAILEGRIVDMRFQNEDPSKVDNSSSLRSRRVIFEIVVHARIMSVRSERELFNMVKTVTIDDGKSEMPENVTSDNFFSKNTDLSELLIKDAFLDFTPKLVQSLKLITWEGRIAALQGDKIYLNVGKISGVQIGDILKVVEDGNEIYDPELGYHVGKVQGRVKGTLEIVGFFGQDGAISVVHSGAGFKENDRVEIYQ